MTTASVSLLFKLLEQPGNNVCADCSQPRPLCANVDFGVLICDQCAVIHQRVCEAIKLIQLIPDTAHNHASHLMELMSRGNTRSKQKYEAAVPPGYWRPNELDPLVLREQWILDKYVRLAFKLEPPSPASGRSTLLINEQRQQQRSRPPVTITMSAASCFNFAHHSTDVYRATHKEGYMFKRGKAKETYQRRLFILDSEENTLRYYNQLKNIYEPKGTYRLDELNVIVLPEKIGHPYGMQITYDIDENTRRNLFIYTQTGKELVEWLCCIRGIKLAHLPAAVHQRSPEEVSDMLTHCFIKEGWLMKMGPNTTDAYRKRWFTLDRYRLLYAKSPLEANPNCITLGGAADGFSVLDTAPPGHRKPPSSCSSSFTLVTPSRKYVIAAELAGERQDWIYWLNVVISSNLCDVRLRPRN